MNARDIRNMEEARQWYQENAHRISGFEYYEEDGLRPLTNIEMHWLTHLKQEADYELSTELVMDKINREELVPQKCRWAYDEVHDKYDTDCGEAFVFLEGNVLENGAKFCIYCGKLIDEVGK